MIKKIAFSIIWLGFISYAFLLAPPNNANTSELIEKLINFELEGINPLIVAIFNLMGVLPLIYAPLLIIDGNGQKLPAWIFTFISFGVGAFAILPYLAFREPDFSQEKTNWFIKILDFRLINLLLVILFVVIFTSGIIEGDWNEFVVQWQNSRFIHVMSLDFCLLILLFPALLLDDLGRRQINHSLFFKTIIWIPLIGTFLYLCLRPSLPEKMSSE
ncbi:DUF2834 domain-containing protein [Euhalothece natronophila Z-M001]|uniref:DUF2834 domain-containing protein n=1 Tax=Euhalothece natronophila Z-M001 TaxID=522448 RepID=A0A5B8NLG4_9CHRO|nr:DUF2834 domain-containing protein [Euhalothece natronophila]QDZ39838.1 DUF2834 domain-containing protein [Euhalothece natronophila Z-M001]